VLSWCALAVAVRLTFGAWRYNYRVSGTGKVADSMPVGAMGDDGNGAEGYLVLLALGEGFHTILGAYLN